VVGSFPGTGCVVPQSFTVRGNRSYLEFWAITGSPRYPGYITLIGHDYENFGTRITWFRDTIENISRKEVLGAKIGNLERFSDIFVNTECVELRGEIVKWRLESGFYLKSRTGTKYVESLGVKL
jgi:hypothetical protein